MVKSLIAEDANDETFGQVYTEKEAEYLAENFLGRLATVSSSGQPHVVPVVYKFDGDSISFGGWNLESTLYFKNLAANEKMGFVVDEVVSSYPWRVKGIEVRGEAIPEKTDGGTIMRIKARVVRSWGLRE